MKQTILLVVLVVLASAVFQDGQLKQGVIFAEEFVEQLKQSNLGRAILQFAELGQLASQFDFNKLFDAIDELKTSMNQAKDDENKLFDEDFQQYVSDVQFFTNQITQYTAEIAQHKTDIRNLNFMLDIYTLNLAKKRTELAQTRSLKFDLEELMKKNEVIYKEKLSEFNQVISTLDSALGLLKQLKDDPDFIQLNHPQFLEVSSNLETSMKSFSHKRIFYEPFITALVQMATEKFADQEMVSKVIRMMQDLRQYLDAGRLSLTNNYESERKANQSLLDTYNLKIKILEEVVIPLLLQLIDTTQGQIKTKQGLLQDAELNLAEAKENLEETEKRWVARQAQHKALIDEYNKELSILDQAVQALAKGGIRRT